VKNLLVFYPDSGIYELFTLFIETKFQFINYNRAVLSIASYSTLATVGHVVAV